jgi:arginine decarboxylase
MTNTTAPTAEPSRPQRVVRTGLKPAWTTEDAADLYQIHGWGAGFFAINDKGHVVVRPQKTARPEVDLYEVIVGLKERGYKTPMLIGFSDLLARRIRDLNDAFGSAIKENGYKGEYRAVYPIKVNQQRHLVEEVQAYGSAFNFGLEVGSKPELLAVLGMTAETPDKLIICNGFKEERYIEFVTLAAKLGRNIIPVIENINELRLVVDLAARYSVMPRIGVRVNLDAQGVGRWRHSSGAKAKFGLSIAEVLDVLEFLRQRRVPEAFQLLHCHIGSQVHNIRHVNDAINELSRIYTELKKMGAGLRYLDIGGGLGVDYDGSQTNFEFSTNYTLAEYAANVVYRVMSVCDDEGVEHPTIVSESGRAMIAHHSVLVFDVLGANRLDRFSPPESLEGAENGDGEVPRPILDLWEAYHAVSERRLLECYHDALHARDEAMSLFNVGYMSLKHRALAERLFWATCVRIRDKCLEFDQAPEELQGLESSLSDTYFCNLSIFQSLPDIWAINQVFPIMPIHRLDEIPTRKATLADLTCDSDGKIDRFVGRRDINRTIDLHDTGYGDEYYIGAFLVGAYQQTLGDLHNLFGDTHLVHIKLDANGQWWLDPVVEGDTVREVLQYVQYDVSRLQSEIRRECERAVKANQITVAESRALVQAYESGLSGYTYLE